MNILIRLFSAVIARGGVEYFAKHHPKGFAVFLSIMALIGVLVILHWLWLLVF